jgi:DNA repair exonuclease SbcCD nuclease subunit
MDRIGRAPYSLTPPAQCGSSGFASPNHRYSPRFYVSRASHDRLRNVLLMLVLVACRETPKPAPAPANSAAVIASPKLRTKHGGMDVRFLVVSDTHLGYGDIAEENAKMIPQLNETGKGARGVVITGDLTEYGQPKQWDEFVKLYGLTGKETALRLPVFEMVGNHDKVNLGPWVEERVSERHATKERFYSWDWDDLHLIALQEGPDDDGLKWLARDLATQANDVALVIFFHLALLGPWSTGNWFDDAYKERFAQAIAGRKVVAIFHGHHHATGHYLWKGYDVWKPGAVKHGAHTFAVVHATDKTWRLDSYNWDLGMFGESFQKPMP